MSRRTLILFLLALPLLIVAGWAFRLFDRA